MPTDLFGRDIDVGQPFSADEVSLIFSGGGQQELVVQSLDVSYRQNITRLWELGSGAQYFVAGHTEGNLSMARVVGPAPVSDAFFSHFGDVCNVQETNIALKSSTGCGTGGTGKKIQADSCVITQVAYRVAAQDMVVNETVSMLVASVSLKSA